YPRCTSPEQLFTNNVQLQHVSSLGEVGPGKWYFDYDADRIYFADDPTGNLVETSVTSVAFQPTADYVTVSNLAMGRDGSIGQVAVIQGGGRTGWTVSGNEVRWNHSEGIRVGTAGHVQGNNVHHNGQMGIAGFGDNLLIENNEIAYNNLAHYEVT